LGNKKRLCIVGLSYKPDTDVIEESPSIKFIELATKEGFHISAVDNNVLKVKEFADLPIYNTRNFQEANEEFDAYVVFVPSKEYSQIPNNISRDKIIIDLWGIWDEFEKSFGENYMRLGNHSG
jgi:UDP-N-acetyl-D-mannosaminuronate dehydrogenase